MRLRRVPIALAVAAACAGAAAPGARADEAGDLVVVARGEAALAWQADPGTGGETGFLTRLRFDAPEAPRAIGTPVAPTSLPGLAVADGHLFAAWRYGRVVRPAQAQAAQEGVYSGVEPARRPDESQVLRSPDLPERVQVVARPDGGHVLVWMDVAGAVRTQAVGASGRTGRVRTLSAAARGLPLAAASGRHAWVALVEARTGDLRVIQLNRAGGIGDDYVIEPTGGGEFATHDIAGNGVGGIIVANSERGSRGTILQLTQVSNSVAYGRDVTRAGPRHRWNARVTHLRGRAAIAYDAPGGGTHVRLGPPRRDLLGRPGPALRLRGVRVQDVEASGRRARLLTRAPRAFALRSLRRDGSRLRAGRSVAIARGATGHGDGRLALDSAGTSFLAWEESEPRDCKQVFYAIVRGRSVDDASARFC